MQDILELLYIKRTSPLMASPWNICKLPNSRKHISGNDIKDTVNGWITYLWKVLDLYIKILPLLKATDYFYSKKKWTFLLARVFLVQCLTEDCVKDYQSRNVQGKLPTWPQLGGRGKGWHKCLVVYIGQVSSFRQTESCFFGWGFLMCLTWSHGCMYNIWDFKILA